MTRSLALATLCDEESGVTYSCTRRRNGHLSEHSSPVMLRKPKQRYLARVISFGSTKDKVPCVLSTPKGFKEHTSSSNSSDKLKDKFEMYLKMELGEFEKASSLGASG